MKASTFSGPVGLTMFYPVPFRRRGMGEGKGKMGQDDHLCLQKAAAERKSEEIDISGLL